MIGQLGLLGRGTRASVIEAENANTAIGKLAGNPNHVVAAVAARQTMHQNDKRAARSPVRRTVIVQHENVAIGKFDDVPSRGIPSLFTRQEVAEQRLSMAASRENQRAKAGFNGVAHEEDFPGFRRCRFSDAVE